MTCEAQGYFFTGARAFSSSNQLNTTRSSGAPLSGVRDMWT
jgi:hypothetical protein